MREHLIPFGLVDEKTMKRGDTMTLDEYKKQEELDEAFDEGFDCGFKSGHNQGFSDGFDCGYKEAKEYNVILDGEILDSIHDFKNQILAYRKEPWSENSEHNHMIFEIHKGLIELTETWVMNQVWDYWVKRKEEIENG